MSNVKSRQDYERTNESLTLLNMKLFKKITKYELHFRERRYTMINMLVIDQLLNIYFQITAR